MSVLSKLTCANIKRNKNRSIVTMLGVALSVALLFVVIAIPTSFWETLREYEISQYGNFHQSFEHIPGDKVEIIEHAKGVESVYYAPQIKYTGDKEYLEDSTTPIPAAAYEKLDSLSEEQRTADKEYIVFVRYVGPIRQSSYAKPMYERYGGDIGYALEDAGVEKYYLRTNSSFLVFEGDIDYNTNTIFLCLATLAIGLVIIASIFTIRNSFNISTTERTREFGMLSSVGATPRQIRRSVVLEALIIGVFAIPVGLVLGTIATHVLLGLTDSLLVADTAMIFFVPWWAIAIDIISGFIIVWMASASAAIRAGRLTPIDAIRSTQDVNIKAKKLKTSKIIASYFGVGGVIASKNLKRSRQKYRTTVVSIVVSIAIFVGLSSFVIDGQRIMTAIYPYEGFEYVAYGASPEEFRDLESKFDLGEHVYVRDAITSNGLYVAVLSSEYFEKFARSVGVRDDFEHAAILNDYVEYIHSNGSRSINRVTENAAGDELHLKTVDPSESDDHEEEDSAHIFDAKISTVTDKKPIGEANLYNPTIYVSENNVNIDKLVFSATSKLFANPGDRAEDITGYIKTVNEKKSEDEEHLAGLDLKEEMKETQNIILLLAIFMYGFIAVVALIGVTNIFNTITTNVQLRAKEFAMLKSVGMTDDEFKRMIRLESVLYTLRALLIGLPIGIFISYGVHYMLGAGGIGLSYELPIIPILISVAVVTILIMLIMHYSVRQVSRQNIIETIRQDTV